jgi:hypothetical protein
MTDTQLYLAIGLPIIAVLASLTVSLVQVSGIREDMRAMRTEFREELRALRADLNTLTGKVIEIDNRLER